MLTIAGTAPFQRKISGLLSPEELSDLIAIYLNTLIPVFLYKGQVVFENYAGLVKVVAKVEALESFTIFTMKVCHFISWQPLVKTRKLIFQQKKSVY